MEALSRLYLERSENELNLADMIMKISSDKTLQLEKFDITKEDTYFSAVISHAYYSIFYCAKAYLLLKGIKTRPPSEHKKAYDCFKILVLKGIVDKELIEIYEDVMDKASALLGIFKKEKRKRGEFTYQKLPQANIEPARKSLENAKKFFKHLYNLCSNLKDIPKEGH